MVGHHSIIKCRCGEVISQCRCPAPDKVVTISTAPCTHKAVIIGGKASSANLFNPPSASEWPEAQPELEEDTVKPWSLHRVARSTPRMRQLGRRPLPGFPDERAMFYYHTCARKQCQNEIECYRVVTGTHTIPARKDVPVSTITLSRQVTDYVYYWRNTAIVVEAGTDYNVKPAQVGLCSYKCLSLWAAKIARDTE